MVQHVGKTIDICEEVKYNDDEKLDKLRIVLKELKEDYLVQHLRRYVIVITLYNTCAGTWLPCTTPVQVRAAWCVCVCLSVL